VGIGIPGLVTEDNQTCFYGEILKFTGITCAEFSQYIPLRTALYNDASVATVLSNLSNGNVERPKNGHAGGYYGAEKDQYGQARHR
jgi:hypothetical protein